MNHLMNDFQIDPSGPLATLRKLLLADEGLAFIAEWVDSHWYAVIAFVVFIILLMVSVFSASDYQNAALNWYFILCNMFRLERHNSVARGRRLDYAN